jgi:hypothetical protein
MGRVHLSHPLKLPALMSCSESQVVQFSQPMIQSFLAQSATFLFAMSKVQDMLQQVMPK